MSFKQNFAKIILSERRPRLKIAAGFFKIDIKTPKPLYGMRLFAQQSEGDMSSKKEVDLLYPDIVHEINKEFEKDAGVNGVFIKEVGEALPEVETRVEAPFYFKEIRWAYKLEIWMEKGVLCLLFPFKKDALTLDGRVSLTRHGKITAEEQKNILSQFLEIYRIKKANRLKDYLAKTPDPYDV